MEETNNENRAEIWAEWLQEMLDSKRWRQADLVNNSHGTVKRDRASKWLSGKESPSYRNAIVVANTLNVSHSSALRAAGFESDEIDQDHSRRLIAAQASIDNYVPPASAQRALAEFPDSILIGEILRRAHEREGVHPIKTLPAWGSLSNVVRDIEDARERGSEATTKHAANEPRNITPGEIDGDQAGDDV
ncbi:helix-turn-helix domain-containing protein [Homoserinimonas aerilata]|uniref:helix-turn-helix domain-containing protein n=1 Tax=Homoserinimonas aerilata TaxID=1162970 RepID=UPI001153FBD0|nr:helix-turn-helix transcriptional regulator [Homoserinimonas aerilata]